MWRDAREVWDISQELCSDFESTMKCCLSLYSLRVGENVFYPKGTAKTSTCFDYQCFALLFLDSHTSVLKSNKKILVFRDSVCSHAS